MKKRQFASQAHEKDIARINEKQKTPAEKWRLVLSAQARGKGVMPPMHIISAGHMGFDKSTLIVGEVQRKVETDDD
jgi:hypothetical protein